MFNTHPHCQYIRQKPGCSTLSKAWPIHESPAIKSARTRLHTRSWVGLLTSSFRWEPKAGGVLQNTPRLTGSSRSSTRTSLPCHLSTYRRYNLPLPTRLKEIASF